MHYRLHYRLFGIMADKNPIAIPNANERIKSIPFKFGNSNGMLWKIANTINPTANRLFSIIAGLNFNPNEYANRQNIRPEIKAKACFMKHHPFQVRRSNKALLEYITLNNVLYYSLSYWEISAIF